MVDFHESNMTTLEVVHEAAEVCDLAVQKLKDSRDRTENADKRETYDTVIHLLLLQKRIIGSLVEHNANLIDGIEELARQLNIE